MAGVKTPGSGTLLTEERFVELLNDQTEVIKKLLASQPVPEPEPEPEPEKPKKCDRGPEIKNVSKKSDKSLSVLFDADKVFKILASVKEKDSGKTVPIADVVSSATGESLVIDRRVVSHFAPDNNTPVLVLGNKLDPGVTLLVKFKATECTGESEFPFFFR